MSERCVLVEIFGGSWSEIQNWPMYMEGRERPRKEADHYRFGGGKYNKQHTVALVHICKGTYILRLFGVLQTSRSLHLPTRILKVYIVALTGLITYSVQGCIFEMAACAGTVGRTYIPKTGGYRFLPLLWSISWVIQRSHPLDDHLQQDRYQD